MSERHNTIYRLFSIGAVDPTNKNVWGFTSSVQRDSFLNARIRQFVNNVQYWRPGSAIKVDMNYMESFKIDYVSVTNEAGTALEKTFYCFVTSREYLSPNSVRFGLTVDIIQTYFFEQNGTPFWMNVQGYMLKTTMDNTPTYGTPLDFAVTTRNCYQLYSDPNDFDVVIFSSIDLTRITDAQHTSAYCTRNGVIMSSPPYLVHGDTYTSVTARYAQLIDLLNVKGLTSSVSNVCVIPKWAINPNLANGVYALYTQTILGKSITVQKPANIDGYVPKNNVILNGGYTQIVVMNNEGESNSYRFEDFNGLPNFLMTVEFASGNIQIICRPTNLKGRSSVFNGKLNAMKITSTPLCSFDNDTYKIWLAQSTNSRQAAIDAATNNLNLAVQARETNWRYQLSKTDEFKNTMKAVQDMFIDVGDKIGNVLGDTIERTGGNGMGFGYSENGTDAYTMQERAKMKADSKLGQGLGTLSNIILQDTLKLESVHELHVNVQRQQDELNKLQASYKDMALIPPTMAGSNAGGDKTAIEQVGFWIAVITPSKDEAIHIDNLITAGGLSVNKKMTTVKAHSTFDYVQMNSPNIRNDLNTRPAYARNMLIELFNGGFYLWYFTPVGTTFNTSPYFGTPYGIQN